MVSKALRITFSLLRLALLTGSVLLLAALFRPVCMDGGVCNYFLLSLLVGIPFGIGRMVLILPPASYDIGGSLGVLALDCLVGGAFGCIAIVYQLTSEVVHLFIAVFE
jgi:hypothetical protein